MEIALLDFALEKHLPSKLAAASLILAAQSIKKVNIWNKEMQRDTNYSESELVKAISDVKSFVSDINPKFLTTLKI